MEALPIFIIVLVTLVAFAGMSVPIISFIFSSSESGSRASKINVFVPVNKYDVTPGNIIFDESGTATRKNGQTMTNRKTRVNYILSQDMSLRRRKSRKSKRM